MPYILQKDRKKLDRFTSQLADKLTRVAVDSDGNVDPGFLNFAISDVLLKIHHKVNYRNLNAIIGALECCKSEYYRRVIAPYENYKCKVNGDIFPVDFDELSWWSDYLKYLENAAGPKAKKRKSRR